MAAPNFSTPLAAIDAVVLDTETTGLDATTARIIQIGAVKIEAGALQMDARFDALVKPGIAIPAVSSKIHGIHDADVAGAPDIGSVFPDLQAFIGQSVLIGHTIGYDLIILRREANRLGIEWQLPTVLDVRALAEVAHPGLAQFDLDRIAEATDVKVTGRHTADGDAMTTARIFVALVPLLRERGIRTVAEALAACRELSSRHAAAGQGNFELPSAVAQPAGLVRIDSYPYRHRVCDVMSSPPVWCPPHASIRDALTLLMERRISSVLIRTDRGPGIITERDILRAMNRDIDNAPRKNAASIASVPLHSLDRHAFVYRAIGRIGRLGVRHLAVTGGEGEIVGMVTTRDLLRQRATTALLLGDAIDAANSVGELGQAWSGLAPMARGLLAEDVDPRQVATVVSHEIQSLTQRAAQLAEERLAKAGLGPAPCRYAVLVLGSVGRGESLLAADQDNAIVFEDGEPGGTIDLWFEALGGHIADILDEVGVVYCKGGVMARNAAWRHSVAGWKTVVDGWVRRQRPEDLLNVDIFFDGAVAHGDAALGEEVLSYAFTVARGARDFLVQLELLASRWHSPVGWLGGLKAGPYGRLDLKLNGLMPIFTGARVLAIRHGIRARSTPGRLQELVDLGIGTPAEIDAVIEAHRTVLGVMLDQQLVDIESGIAPSPRVDLKRLSKHSTSDLKQALGKVGTVVDLVSQGRI